jgi:hypothetical protein
MKHDWMIGALEDLGAYARLNDLPALAAHLHEAKLLAMIETVSQPAQKDLRPIDCLRQMAANPA